MNIKTSRAFNKLIVKYNLNASAKQIYVISKILFLKNNKKSFLQFFKILLNNLSTHGIDAYDFLQLKDIMFKLINMQHGVITKERYLVTYGKCKGQRLYKEYVKRKTDNWKPERCDTRSLDYCVEKYGEEHGLKIYKQRCAQAGKSTRVEYFLNKGLTYDEAKLALKERQATCRLDNFIKRHGEIEGIKRWKERQEKWQSTLNSKSKDEIDIINAKKSSKHYVWKKDSKGRLYYIKFYNDEIEFWKIGITTKTIEERFRNITPKFNLKYDIILNKEDFIFNCWDLEQRTLRFFDEFRIYALNYNGFKTSEAFSKDVLREFRTNI